MIMMGYIFIYIYIRRLLNKITVETFQSMATQILLIIETADAELFRGIVRLIFDKVFNHFVFCILYMYLFCMEPKLSPSRRTLTLHNALSHTLHNALSHTLHNAFSPY